ncbi:MAG: hypothetical protein ACR2PM_04525, partial [Hyphomicrobiales bacterium]
VGDRKTVFVPGETIQYNVSFLADSGASASEVRLYFVVEPVANYSTTAEDHYETIYRPQRILKGEGLVGTDPAHASWTAPIPEVPLVDAGDGRLVRVPLEGTRAEATQNLARGEFNLLFVPGFYKFFAIVQLTELATGRPFDVSDTSVYSIDGS